MGTEKSGPRDRRLAGAAIEEVAARLRVLGDAKRIALVEALATGGEASVQGLADRIGVSHQNASHHLSLLRRAGVVDRRADGPTGIYAIEDWTAWWVVSQLAELAGEEAAGRPDQAGGPCRDVGSPRRGSG